MLALAVGYLVTLSGNDVTEVTAPDSRVVAETGGPAQNWGRLEPRPQAIAPGPAGRPVDIELQ
jgi:hypothetical protein